MPTLQLGSVNPKLLAQCPERPTPPNALTLPVHVTRWGQQGERVLLVHGGVQGGIGGGPANFVGQKSLADKGWRLELLDRPGFGESPSRGPDDMEADALLIAELLGDGAHLVGHSFGGAEALLAAALRPEAVRSLILIEPALQPMLAARPGAADDPAAKAAGDVVMRHLLGSQTPAAFARSFLGNLGRSETGQQNSVAAGVAEDETAASALGCSLLQSRMTSPAAMLAAAHAVRSAGIRTLVITGGYSDGQEATGAVVAEETGGHCQVVACASHFIQHAVPDQFNFVADAFMRGAA